MKANADDTRHGPDAEVIVQVKDGVVSNALCLLFLLSLCAFLIFWMATHNDMGLRVFGSIICLAWLFVAHVCLRNMLNPKSAVLTFRGDQLVWIVRAKESAQCVEAGIPLRSIETLEFVLPATKYQNNARLYSLSELFIVDCHGNRVLLPQELFPGVYREKITKAIRERRPAVHVVERIVQDNHG
jgi:hypothetical protein